MSWAVGFNTHWNRDIGYGVPAVCDHPKCNKHIDRGLSHICGGLYYEDHGCGLCFCATHLMFHSFRDGETAEVCIRCHTYRKPFNPKPDLPVWTTHKMTDPSWAEWRESKKVRR